MQNFTSNAVWNREKQWEAASGGVAKGAQQWAGCKIEVQRIYGIHRTFFLLSLFFISAESKLNKIQWRRWRRRRWRPMQSWPPQPTARKLARSEVPARRFVWPRSLAHSLQVTMGVTTGRGREGELSEYLGISLLNRQMLRQVKRNQIDK